MSDKTMINPSHAKSRNRAKIEQEEKELEELLKQAANAQEQAEEEEQEEEVVEKPVEEKPKKAEKKKEEPKEEEESSEEKTFKKRYGDLRRHAQKTEEALRKEIEALKNKDPSVVPPKSDEDLEEWAKKYPDVASIVNTIAAKQAKKMFEDAEERLNRIDELQAEADRKTAEAQIIETHSDFLKIRDSDDFHDWADDQPKWVQDALYENENDARSVIRVIDLYKVDKGLTAQDKKNSQKDAAASVAKGTKSEPSTNSGKTFRESVVDKMSDEEWEKNEEAIMEAMRNGNFVYDITGGARVQ